MPLMYFTLLLLSLSGTVGFLQAWKNTIDMSNQKKATRTRRVQAIPVKRCTSDERRSYIKWGSNSCTGEAILGLQGMVYAVYNEKKVVTGSDLMCLPTVHSAQNIKTANLSKGYEIAPLPFRVDLIDSKHRKTPSTYLSCVHCIVKTHDLMTLIGQHHCSKSPRWKKVYTGVYATARTPQGGMTAGICVSNIGVDTLPISTNLPQGQSYGQPIKTAGSLPANKQVPCVVCRYIPPDGPVRGGGSYDTESRSGLKSSKQRREH